MTEPATSASLPSPRVPTHGAPTHPGEMLRAEFVRPLGLSADALAPELGLEPAGVEALLAGTRPVDAALASRLERRFAMPAAFWLTLQAVWDASSGSLEPPSPDRGSAARSGEGERPDDSAVR